MYLSTLLSIDASLMSKVERKKIAKHENINQLIKFFALHAVNVITLWLTDQIYTLAVNVNQS